MLQVAANVYADTFMTWKETIGPGLDPGSDFTLYWIQFGNRSLQALHPPVPVLGDWAARALGGAGAATPIDIAAISATIRMPATIVIREARANEISRKGELMRIHRLHVDRNGESHFEDVTVQFTESNRAGRMSARLPATGIIFREVPAQYDLDWHPAPRRQYIINLDAGVELTASDGETRRIGAGEVILVEDTWGKATAPGPWTTSCVTVSSSPWTEPGRPSGGPGCRGVGVCRSASW